MTTRLEAAAALCAAILAFAFTVSVAPQLPF
jgi:hypothetical protein